MNRKKKDVTSSDAADDLLPILLGWPWLEIAAQTWKAARTLWRGMADEGLYEVLEYESKLELLDPKGEKAKFNKREKVRYLQNNIIAYQDHAWGDGKILVDYCCRPGTVVDRYRPGHKTYLLISLRDSKDRGDVDEFNIEWDAADSFVRDEELWETEILHRTRQMTNQVIFPKSRPPFKVWVEENIRRTRQELDSTARRQLPDGRWQVTWATANPRLNERYQLRWSW